MFDEKELRLILENKKMNFLLPNCFNLQRRKEKLGENPSAAKALSSHVRYQNIKEITWNAL